MSILNRTIITVLAFAFMQGCASQPKSLSQVYDRFEEEDYTNWEKDVAYIEKMEAEYHGNLAAHLINSYDEYGQPLDSEYIENTLGFEVYEKAFIVASLFTPLTKLSIASLLAMNSDSPSFGSPEYATQIYYRRDVNQMSQNTHFFSSSFNPDELDTYKGITPKSKHHEIHLKTKEAFLTGLNSAINALSKQGIKCSPLGYNSEKHGSNYAYSRILIHPLRQYEASYLCFTDGEENYINMNTFAVRDKNEYRIVSRLSMGDFKSLERVDPIAIIENTVWQGTMSTCRTCDLRLDRVVKITSKNQDKEWVKEFEKGSLYPTSN